MLLQKILKKVKATIDAVRSPPSIETHRALALLAARSVTEKVFVQPNEPTFRVFQRAASRLLVNTSPLTSGDLVVKPSSIPGSGNGVFANRSFATGETLTLYPGCIYSSLSVPSLETSAFDSVRETDHSLLLPQPRPRRATLHVAPLGRRVLLLLFCLIKGILPLPILFMIAFAIIKVKIIN